MSFRYIKAMILMMAFAITSVFAMPTSAAGFDMLSHNISIAGIMKTSLINDKANGAIGEKSDDVLIKASADTTPISLPSHSHNSACSYRQYQLTGDGGRASATESMKTIEYQYAVIKQHHSYRNDKVPWTVKF